jgi:hypothetical protein
MASKLIAAICEERRPRVLAPTVGGLDHGLILPTLTCATVLSLDSTRRFEATA